MTNQEYPLERLTTLSYSRYLRLKRCLLSGAVMAKKSRLFRAPGPSRRRSQVLGEILHEMMASINGASVGSLNQAAFRARFNAVVKATHIKLVGAPSSRHLGDPGHWPELASLYRYLSELVEMRLTGDPGVEVTTYAERRLSSSDGVLWGQVDAYFISKDGIHLVDYKSGAIGANEDGPKEEYREQLYFYAYLIHENHGDYPRSVSLIGRSGEVVSLPASPERSAALADDMRAVLDKYNDLVSRERALNVLATPTSEACVFCERKSICNKFWLALPSLSTPAWNHVAMGVQTTPLVRTPRGGGWFEMTLEKSSLFTRAIKVTRVFEQRFPEVDLVGCVGQRLLLTGLRQAAGSNVAIVEATEFFTVACLGVGCEE